MPDNSNTLTLTLQFKEDGSVIIESAKNKIVDLGKKTAESSEKASGALKLLKEEWLGFTAAAASIYGVEKGLEAFVNKAIKAEEAESRMAFQVEAAGIKYEKVKRGLEGYTDSIVSMTRYTKEPVEEGFERILQFTSDLNEAFKWLGLAMDMTVHDGESLETNIRYVGMAMNGEIEILGKLNPAFKDLGSKLDEDTSKADKSAYAFKKLYGQFGGAAVRDLKTHAGQVSETVKQWSELQKTLGTAVLPVLDKVLERLNQMGKAALLSSGKGTQKEILEAQINKLEAQLLSLEAEQPYVSEKAQLEILDKIEAARKRIPELAEEEKKAAEAVTEESEKAQSLRYMLGMKGVAEEAAQFRKDLKTMYQSTEAFDFAMKSLGVTSTSVLTREAQDALRNAEIVKKAFQTKKASVRDYVGALDAASEAIKKLVGTDKTDQLIKNEEEYQRRIREISPEDPDRQKKVQAAIDDWLSARKEIEKAMKIPVQADVAPAERQLDELIRKADSREINIKVNTSQTSGGADILGIPMSDFFTGGGVEGTANINFFGTGSTRKPISEKIQEIIDQYGGLDKALSGMEAEINLSQLTHEYENLEKQLEAINQIGPSIWQALSWGGNPQAWFGSWAPAMTKQILQEINEIKYQMGQTQMQMQYEMLKSYVGSYQTGTSYVPRTGLALVHQGEQIIPRNVSSSITVINNISGGDDPQKIGDSIVKCIKYRLNGELYNLLKK
jgi:hypothetical protein